MVIKKKGQMVFVNIMLAVIAFIVAVVIIPPITDQVTQTRNATNLNCSNPAASAVTKGTCVVVDVGLFYLISSIIAAGIALLSGKKTFIGIVSSIMVFVVTVIFITPLKDWIILARSGTYLNCASSTILVGARMTCLVVDLWLFYFVAVALAAGVTYTFAKKVIPSE